MLIHIDYALRIIENSLSVTQQDKVYEPGVVDWAENDRDSMRCLWGINPRQNCQELRIGIYIVKYLLLRKGPIAILYNLY